MPKTREIRGRIKAVGNIQRITKTMQMIATARFQAAQKRAVASQPFAQRIAEMVRELAQASSAGGESNGLRHPLLTPPAPPAGRRLVLVITSNRGLCGAYNANILRTTTAHLETLKGQQVDLEVVGKKGAAYFKFAGVPVARFHGQFTDRPAYADVNQLAQRYMDEFTQGKYDSVEVIYMSFESIARQRPRVQQILPLRPPAAAKQEGPAASAKPKASPVYDFYPDVQTILAQMLPITVKTEVFQCFNEAVVGEQIARMVAMKSATDAAQKMGRTLTRRYNRVRQTAITTELMEIIGGAAGLE